MVDGLGDVVEVVDKVVMEVELFQRLWKSICTLLMWPCLDNPTCWWNHPTHWSFMLAAVPHILRHCEIRKYEPPGSWESWTTGRRMWSTWWSPNEFSFQTRPVCLLLPCKLFLHLCTTSKSKLSSAFWTNLIIYLFFLYHVFLFLFFYFCVVLFSPKWLSSKMLSGE